MQDDWIRFTFLIAAAAKRILLEWSLHVFTVIRNLEISKQTS